MNKLIKFLTIFFTLIVLTNCNISDKRLCADPECKTLISLAKTTLKYNSGAKGILSFPINTPVRVFSKSAGKNPDLWGVEIQGRRGYAPHKLLQETKIVASKNDLIYEVPTVLVSPESVVELKSSETVKTEEIVPTTTTPLPVSGNSAIVTNENELNGSGEKPKEASPVLEQMQVIDGTQLPVDIPEVTEAIKPVETVTTSPVDSDVKLNSSTENIAPAILPTDSPKAQESTNENKAPAEEIKLSSEKQTEAIDLGKDEDDGIVEDLTESPLNKTVRESEEEFYEDDEDDEEEDDEEDDEEEEDEEIIDPSINRVVENVTVPSSAAEDKSEKLEESALNSTQNSVSEKPNDPAPQETANLENVLDEKLPAPEIPKIVEAVPLVTTQDVEIKLPDAPYPLESFADANLTENEKVPLANQQPAEPQPIVPVEAKKTEEVPSLEETGLPTLKVEEELPLPLPSDPVEAEKVDETPLPTRKIEELPPPPSIPTEATLPNQYVGPTPNDLSAKISTENVPDQPQVPPTTTPSYEDAHPLDPILDVTTPNPVEDATKATTEPSRFIPSLPLFKPTAHTPENVLPPLVPVEPVIPAEIAPETVNSASADQKNVHVQSDEKAEAEIPEAIPSTETIIADDKNSLFATILGTVQSFWSVSGAKEKPVDHEHMDNELTRILFPDGVKSTEGNVQVPVDDEYCEKLTPNQCPTSSKLHAAPPHRSSLDEDENSRTAEECSFPTNFFALLAQRILNMVDLLACMGIAGASSLLFCFGYYCISSTRKESSLLSKLNFVERSLLAANKEAAILKHDLTETRNKLSSIENNSFGSNDMVISLKTDLENSEAEKAKVQEQVLTLEKELENAAEAGLELNKIVSELLNSQNGDASIISSVEELQKQLNEQQNTILEINTILAEKSRENSELQLIIAEQNAKFEGEIESLKQDNEELESEKSLVQSRLDEIKTEFEMDITKALESKNFEIKLLQTEITNWQPKYEEVYKKWQTSVAKIDALEECLKVVKKDSNVNMSEFMEVANLKAEFSALARERDLLKERLETENDTKKLLTDQVNVLSEEVKQFKQDFNQTEKDKLEAQTRLEVLSNYFKEKETQLQKELSVKEAMWMKQQGETTSTVERVRNMQEEIQGLKSKNDSLLAEIEAQVAAHKAQIGTLENRAHETWLSARQSERKYEEARSEATALRRKLTSLAGNANGLPNSVVDGLPPPPTDLNNAPSPIHMESPGSPMLSGLPPPPPFLPPPFMGAPPHPHHFMPMPPPFMPPGEMRPPPLGRLMSPPPPHPLNRYSPSILDDDDYDDEEDREDERHRGRYSNRNGRYSPDNRYNYNNDIISTYDTETDFSPPPSPHARGGIGAGTAGYRERERERDRDRDRRNSRGNGSYKAYSPQPQQVPSNSVNNSVNNNDRSKKSNKGILSSGSEQSFDSRKSKGKGLV